MQRCIYDCHSHTFLCGHAEMVAPRLYHKLIYEKGFKGYAFCCHNPFINNDVTPEYRMPYRDFEIFLNAYKIEKQFAAENFPELDLTLNMEVDYHPADPSKTEQFIKLTDQFDCLLGSVHYYYELSQIKPQNYINFVKKYVQQFKNAVATGWFQIMSHYDFFKARFGCEWYFENFDEIKEILTDGLNFLAETNKQRQQQGLELISLELNTGGLQYGVDMFLPNEKIIALAVSLGIPIAIGSDAHYSLEAGREVKQALQLLNSLQVKTVSYYKQKKRCEYDVEQALQSFCEVDAQKIVDQFKNEQKCNQLGMYYRNQK